MYAQPAGVVVVQPSVSVRRDAVGKSELRRKFRSAVRGRNVDVHGREVERAAVRRHRSGEYCFGEGNAHVGGYEHGGKLGHAAVGKRESAFAVGHEVVEECRHREHRRFVVVGGGIERRVYDVAVESLVVRFRVERRRVARVVGYVTAVVVKHEAQFAVYEPVVVRARDVGFRACRGFGGEQFVRRHFLVDVREDEQFRFAVRHEEVAVRVRDDPDGQIVHHRRERRQGSVVERVDQVVAAQRQTEAALYRIYRHRFVVY